MMDRRRKWMYIAVGVALAIFLGDLGYRNFVELPRARFEGAVEGLETREKELKSDLIEASRELKKLERIEMASLPANVEIARSAYTGWLLELVEQAGFQSPRVDPSEPSAINVRRPGSRQTDPLGSSLAFSVRGSASLPQVTQFLHAFYSADKLHKIRSLSLLPRGGGAVLDVALEIEAISLLSSHVDRTSDEQSDRLRHEPLSAYREIGKRNLWRAGGGDVLLTQIRLTGVTLNAQGQREAWFSLADGRTLTIAEGESLNLPTLDCRVLQLTQDAAQAIVDGQEIQIAIGQSLAEAAQR